MFVLLVASNWAMVFLFFEEMSGKMGLMCFFLLVPFLPNLVSAGQANVPKFKSNEQYSKSGGPKRCPSPFHKHTARNVVSAPAANDPEGLSP